MGACSVLIPPEYCAWCPGPCPRNFFLVRLPQLPPFIPFLCLPDPLRPSLCCLLPPHTIPQPHPQAAVEMSRKYRHVAWYSLFVAAYMVVLYLQVGRDLSWGKWADGRQQPTETMNSRTGVC